MSVPDYPLDATVDFKFTTRAFATGIPTTLAGTPAIEIYEDNDTEQITAAETLSVDFDSVTGLNNLRVVMTTANGFESGKSYHAVISAGTVGGVSVVGEVVAQFSIERSPALRPTTAGRTLDVSATGEAGLDFDNIKDATGAHTLTNITVPTTTAVTDGVTLANGAVTDASLAGNMEIVFETDFGTNYDTDRDAWVTNVQDFVGTTADDPFSAKVVATISAGTIDNATFAADVGSTAYATNIIALAVRKALDEIKLDHLVAVADADDVVDNSIIAKLTSKSGTADWSDFVNTTDSLQAIADKVIAASPQAHAAGSSTDTTGTIDSGTYADTATINSTYWQISPAGAAVGGFGLNVQLHFDIGTGLDRIPESVNITGYFDAIAVRDAEVWAYNYNTTTWDQLSNSATHMDGSETSSQNYQYTNLTADHVQTSDGEVLIRFTSTSTTTGDDLYLDYVSVGSVAVEAAGLTADAIQNAVWGRADSGHDESTLGYNVSKLHLKNGNIVSATDATRFVIDFDIPTNDIYNGMIITLEDKTDDHYEIRRIVDTIAASDEIVVDRAFGFTPAAGDDYYIMNAAYGDVNLTHVGGTAQTAGDLADLVATAQTSINAIGSNTSSGLTETVRADNTGAAIEGISSVGNQTGTWANLVLNDSVYHQIDHDSGAIDIVYNLDVGTSARAVDVIWSGYLTGTGNTITVQAYDHVSAWETIGFIASQGASTTDRRDSFRLRQAHTKTDGTVYIRFKCTEQPDTPSLYLDELVVSLVDVKLRSTGLSLVTAWTVDITGSLSGSVGSVTAMGANAIDAASFASDVDAEAQGWLGMAAADLDTQLGAIVLDTGTTIPALLAAVYHAEIHCIIDETNTQDEYTVTWFLNGVRITSGITSPVIQVVKRSDGTDLVAASTAMTEIGSTASYKYDEDTDRLTAGEPAVAIASATIDGSTRSFAKIVGRDSSE